MEKASFMDPFQVCCLGEKWQLSVGRSRGRAHQKHREAMEERTATFALCKELQPGGGKGAEGSFENLLGNQSKSLAENLCVKLTDA